MAFRTLIFCLLFCFSPAAAGTIAASERPTVAPVLRKVTPGVVNIATRRVETVNIPLLQDRFVQDFFDIPDARIRQEVKSAGSGVIVDAEHGYVLTNEHVVRGADMIEVTTKDNRRFRARLIGRDRQNDLAILAIPPDRLTAVELGDSRELQVGDFVLAIGNPFGLGQTVTSGIVSALGRTGGTDGHGDFIQTDASINPGNSGGALVTLDGKLVGINTAILSKTGANIGIGFAAPIDRARNIMSRLLAGRSETPPPL
jgi:S1-C subfamily serine protease